MKKALATIFKVLVFFIGWALLAGVIDVPNNNPAVWRFFAELIPLVVLVVFSVVFLIIEKGEVKLQIRENAGKGALIGLLTGLVWIGTSSVILLASNQIIIVEKNNVTFLWLWIVSAVINVIMQELLIRGYLYQLLKTKYNLPMAVIFTTVLFTALHGGAIEAGIIPTVNVITMCLFTSALYEAEKTILSPIMAHAAWNVIGAIIIGGVSLADDYPSLYSTVASENILLSGGDNKIEGSVVVTIINIVLMLVFYFIYRKKRARQNHDLPFA